MPSKAQLETEIKLHVASIAALRTRLKKIGARKISSRVHEFNTLFDTAEKSLDRAGRIVRIRVKRHAAGRGRVVRAQTDYSQSHKPIEAILTFKGPSKSRSRGKKAGRPRYKINQELEVTVSDARQTEQILDNLGLRPVFHYEKFRTTYALPKIKGVQVELDETPLGAFLELEGTPAAIDRAAHRLGYSSSDYVTASYGDLSRAASRRGGIAGGDLLFKPAKKPR